MADGRRQPENQCPWLETADCRVAINAAFLMVVLGEVSVSKPTKRNVFREVVWFS